MEPRKPSSHHVDSQALPPAFLELLEETLLQRFREPLAEKKLYVEGRIYAEELLVRFGFRNPSELAQVNFETSVDFEPEKTDVNKLLNHCIDFLGDTLAQYFQSQGTLQFPRNWKEITWENQVFFLQTTAMNSDLEAQANQLLREAGLNPYDIANSLSEMGDEDDPELLH